MKVALSSSTTVTDLRQIQVVWRLEGADELPLNMVVLG